jgi:5-bromo-4-chloroindolyl phosphate hydrolysis protein
MHTLCGLFVVSAIGIFNVIVTGILVFIAICFVIYIGSIGCSADQLARGKHRKCECQNQKERENFDFFHSFLLNS